MNELLDLIDINGLDTEEEIIKYATRAKTEDLIILANAMRRAVDVNDHKLNEHSPFSFIASPEVSGAGGCFERSCRLKRTDSFAIYSALYADKVYININIINNHHFFQAFNNDIIYPSFSQLNSSLRKLHRNSVKKVIGQFFVTASVVSLGVYTGFVPADPKSILTALGGVGAFTKAGSSVIDWSRKKDEIKDNDYFFLWRLKN